MAMGDRELDQQTLHLPRILCLHGGGTNARIFKAQCRVLERSLAPHFRLAYAEASAASLAGPDVVSVYADYGPFKRWLRWLPEHTELDDRAAIAAIDSSVRSAMAADDAAGATGPWVGLLGFSQGAKLAASLLFRQQVRAAKLGTSRAGSTWRFAVIMAGRAPIVSLDPDVFRSSMLGAPSEIGLSAEPDYMDVTCADHMLELPTIHVHGLTDPGLHLHRDLVEQYCVPGSARILEWEGGHRVPLKATDVNPLVDDMLLVARQTGAIPSLLSDHQKR